MPRKRSVTWQYVAYGSLFGLLFPIIATLLDLYLRGWPPTLTGIARVQMGSPLHWIVDTAPLFLGLFAGLAGRKQDGLIRTNQALAQKAADHEQALAQVQSLQAGLEQQIADRTAGLATAVEVGRVATSILDMDAMARQVVDLICSRFDLYYAGLFLLDDAGDRAVLLAGSGEAGRRMVEAGHNLAVGGRSMVGAACALRQARIALDVGDEPVRFDNPLLPRTRSEMALPLIVSERVLGALDVQSVEPAAFSDHDVAVLQLVAGQIAVATDNARRFSEEAALLEATNPIFRASRRLTAAATATDVAQVIVDAVSRTDVDGCSVSRVTTSPAGEVETTAILAHWGRRGVSDFPTGARQPAGSASPLLKPVTEFWVVEDILQELALAKDARRPLSYLGPRALANIPLEAGGRVVGYVSVWRSTPGPFSRVSLRLYQTVAEQAVAALERARLLEEAQRRAAREQRIGQVAARMRETLDLDTILATAVTEIAASLNLAALDLRLIPSPEWAISLPTGGDGRGEGEIHP